ncbi:hypothetical protein SUDANB121_03404 [Nocardiopsis dassonvillei]|uniref:DUF4097 family beta strand repeat-containing protein n=1 Tax=Nocardiopsis dassonvillei TaxID=2014 RepID=UPI003F5477BF
MPVFDTPEPITADIGLVAGALQVAAGDGSETVVEVRPRVADRESDVRAAEQVEVSYADGHLTVTDPPQGSGLGRLLRNGLVDIAVELPAGSRLRVTSGYGNVRCTGTLGPSDITVSSGNITAHRIAGGAGLTTAHGWIRVREIDGSAVVKSTTGGITIGEVTGDFRANSAHGEISVDRALSSVTARTTYGNIRLGRVGEDGVDTETSYGEIEIGVPEGTATWFDALSGKGAVRSSLEAAEAPAPTERTLRVRARSVHGDITLHRA